MRFRIRSLMVLTAVVAVACSVIPGVIVATDALVRAAVLIGLLAIGPLIGSIRAGRRYAVGRIDPLEVGLLGGLVQATLLMPLLALPLFFSGEFPLPSILGTLLIGWLILLGIHAFSGVMVGLFFCFWFAIRDSARRPIEPAEARSTDEQSTTTANRL